MGGDGGVVATNRRYMRGAGTAKDHHTADTHKSTAVDLTEAERERVQQIMQNCAVTGFPLDFSSCSSVDVKDTRRNFSLIVACPYGRLYNREAAVESLLRRMEQSHGELSSNAATADGSIGWHVRGLKDLYPVHFHEEINDSRNQIESYPTCPITGVDLNGMHPTYVVVSKEKNKKKLTELSDAFATKSNVISEKALKEMGTEALETEYGLFELVRLAPPPGITFETIKDKLIANRLLNTKRNKGKIEKCSSKKMVKKKKQREIKTRLKKANNINENYSIKVRNGGASSNKEHKREVKKTDTVYTSLFTHTKSNLSEKEKTDNLFVR